MSGTEMLLQAALKAFVPKEVAERYVAQAAEMSTIVEGMVRDGTLQGIGTLLSDIQEIKRSQARIEFGLGRIFALIQSEQQILESGTHDGLPGSSRTGPCNLTLAEHRTDGRSGGGLGASGQLDDGSGGEQSAA